MDNVENFKNSVCASFKYPASENAVGYLFVCAESRWCMHAAAFVVVILLSGCNCPTAIVAGRTNSSHLRATCNYIITGDGKRLQLVPPDAARRVKMLLACANIMCFESYRSQVWCRV
jgi:hypothetical protein